MGSSDDHKLGMDSNITRRDFLNGVAVTIGASMIPGVAAAQQNSGPDPYNARTASGAGNHAG